MGELSGGLYRHDSDIVRNEWNEWFVPWARSQSRWDVGECVASWPPEVGAMVRDSNWTVEMTGEELFVVIGALRYNKYLRWGVHEPSKNRSFVACRVESTVGTRSFIEPSHWPNPAEPNFKTSALSLISGVAGSVPRKFFIDHQDKLGSAYSENFWICLYINIIEIIFPIKLIMKRLSVLFPIKLISFKKNKLRLQF